MDSDDEKARLLSSPTSSRSSSRSPSPTPSGSSSRSPSRSPSPSPLGDSRFVRPAPSPWKRAALLVFVAVLLWLAFSMRSGLLEAKRKPKVIHASRYSKEHKFRPAASPVITETLKDGRVRLRGALQTPTATPTPTVKPSTGKMSGKRKGKKRSKKRQGQGKRM